MQRTHKKATGSGRLAELLSNNNDAADEEEEEQQQAPQEEQKYVIKEFNWKKVERAFWLLAATMNSGKSAFLKRWGYEMRPPSYTFFAGMPGAVDKALEYCCPCYVEDISTEGWSAELEATYDDTYNTQAQMTKVSNLSKKVSGKKLDSDMTWFFDDCAGHEKLMKRSKLMKNMASGCRQNDSTAVAAIQGIKQILNTVRENARYIVFFRQNDPDAIKGYWEEFAKPFFPGKKTGYPEFVKFLEEQTAVPFQVVVLDRQACRSGHKVEDFFFKVTPIHPDKLKFKMGCPEAQAYCKKMCRLRDKAERDALNSNEGISDHPAASSFGNILAGAEHKNSVAAEETMEVTQFLQEQLKLDPYKAGEWCKSQGLVSVAASSKKKKKKKIDKTKKKVVLPKKKTRRSNSLV
jgi:hypothetical protein